MIQGTFTFPGIVGVLSANCTFGLGITPSVTQVSIPPTPGLPRMGTAVWAFGDVVRVMPFSAVDSIQVARQGGLVTWSVSILDRRWAWSMGMIEGEYNIPTAVGKAVIPDTEKNVRELAAILLDEMGETDYDVSVLPDDDRPYTRWEGANPARALSDLCDAYACAVSLGIDNRVRIVRLGEGLPLPAGHLENEIVIDPAEFPRNVRVVTAPVQYQIDIKLEAVGEERARLNPEWDPDDTQEQGPGEILPIDELSYRPPGGWQSLSDPGKWEKLQDPDSEHTNHDLIRSLAQKSVYKWYRVSAVSVSLPDFGVVDEIYQVLPILTSEPMTVWGRFTSGGLWGDNTSSDPVAGNLDPKMVLTLPFDVDGPTGLVRFSNVVGRSVNGPSGYMVSVPADLFVRCFVNAKEKETRAPKRFGAIASVDPSSPVDSHWVIRDDLVVKVSQRGGAFVSNESRVTEQLEFYLEQELERFAQEPGEAARYAGFVPIGNDGAIRQISYSIDANGLSSTHISRNAEQFQMGLTFEESKRRQEIRDIVDQERQAKRRPSKGRI